MISQDLEIMKESLYMFVLVHRVLPTARCEDISIDTRVRCKKVRVCAGIAREENVSDIMIRNVNNYTTNKKDESKYSSPCLVVDHCVANETYSSMSCS